MFVCNQLVLPFLILGKLEDTRIPYTFTYVLHFRIIIIFTYLTKVCVWIVLQGYFYYSTGMTSGILSEPRLVNFLLLCMIAC